MSTGITGYGTYLPYWRLERTAITEALDLPAGTGVRTVASYDEDTASMGVEAARYALDSLPPDAMRDLRWLIFATTRPPYLDKTNATALHAALCLDSRVTALDVGASVRSGVGSLRAALECHQSAMVIVSDISVGLPASRDERDGGDGAAALIIGQGSPTVPVLAEYLGGASATAEFLDRWRVPGDLGAKAWEERFGQHAYGPLADQALTDGLKECGMTVDDIDHLIVTGTHPRAARGLVAGLDLPAEAVVDDLSGVVGCTGAAHPALLLASALESAAPGETIALVVLSDGAEAMFFQTTDDVRSFRPRTTLRRQLEQGGRTVGYGTYLTWRGVITREAPRRPNPTPPAAPPSLRAEDWKFAFVGSRCGACGAIHLPPARVCLSCRAIDQMTPEPMSGVNGTITTYTVDRLAYSLSPPVTVAVVDFEGGGRFMCELTDVDPDAVDIGETVEMTFRRTFTVGGVHNYFWKARPVRSDV